MDTAEQQQLLPLCSNHLYWKMCFFSSKQLKKRRVDVLCPT